MTGDAKGLHDGARETVTEAAEPLRCLIHTLYDESLRDAMLEALAALCDDYRFALQAWKDTR